MAILSSIRSHFQASSLLKSWSIWFLYLAISQLYLVILLFSYSVYGNAQFHLDYFRLLAFLAGFISGYVQWLLLKKRLPRSSFWIVLQVFVLLMASLEFQLLTQCFPISLGRSFSLMERSLSFFAIALMFLVPEAVVSFVYLRVKKVSLPKFWFLYFFLAGLIGTVAYFFLDVLEFSIFPHQAYGLGDYLQLVNIIIPLTAIVIATALIFSEVRFPLTQIAETQKSEYLQSKYRSRVRFWLSEFDLLGIMIALCLFFLMGYESPWPIQAIVICIACIVYCWGQWAGLSRLIQLKGLWFYLSLITFPVFFLIAVLIQRAFDLDDVYSVFVFLGVSCLVFGFLQYFGLRKSECRVKWGFIFHMIISILIGLILFLSYPFFFEYILNSAIADALVLIPLVVFTQIAVAVNAYLHAAFINPKTLSIEIMGTNIAEINTEIKAS